MTQDEIIELYGTLCKNNLETLAKLVAAKERDAVEERVVDLFTDMETPYLPDIVKAIREKG